MHLVLWYHPPHLQVDHLEGWKKRWITGHSPSLILPSSFLPCHWCLFPSLTTPPSHTFLLRQLRLSLSCFEPTSLISRSGWALSALWCAACLPCLPPSPLCWQSGGSGGAVYPANAPLLLPSAVCSVNPHCLVVLFELT